MFKCQTKWVENGKLKESGRDIFSDVSLGQVVDQKYLGSISSLVFFVLIDYAGTLIKIFGK